MINQDQSPSFADVAVIHRTVSMPLFERVNAIVDFSAIEAEIANYYQKGKSVDGRNRYPILVLFKMMLLQTWYGLSDEGIEEQINDRISFSKFVVYLWGQKLQTVRYGVVLGRY